MHKVLFLPSFFPTESEPLAGLFIKKHAMAAARYTDLFVLSVGFSADRKGKKYYLKVVKENGLNIARVRCKMTRPRMPKLSYLIDLVRYFKGTMLGFKEIRKRWGKPDIVHLNVSWPAGLTALYLRVTERIPYIVSEHWSGYVAETGRFKKTPVFAKNIIRIIFRKAKAVTAVSDYLARSLISHHLVHRKPLVVPNVVEIPEELRRQKKDVHTVRALTVSLLHDGSKNISGLIQAFKEVARKHSNVQLDILGDGEDRGKLTTLTHNLGLLNKKVFFHGYVPNDQLHKWFAKANFFVLNSNYETFSVAIAEAIAHGVPVVVTRCGGPEEFVTPQVGILVERKNIESLITGLAFMIDNWRKYDRLRLHNHIKRLMSPDNVGKRFLEIYEGALKR
ncbi:glycosyltransferase [candidate division WOR-3 bacterium]|nr:glycosyltransferase [candidate division WOR-3 bacterium]